MNRFAKLFLSFDIFATYIQLDIDKEKKSHKTYLGSLFSITFYTFCIYYSVIGVQKIIYHG
jgi:hypothetical protein